MSGGVRDGGRGRRVRSEGRDSRGFGARLLYMSIVDGWWPCRDGTALGYTAGCLAISFLFPLFLFPFSFISKAGNFV